jgi:UDP-N-acetylglucosamine 2-epimerase (non-hydrolysing)
VKTVLCVVGTRPEAVKMAPVVLALRREPWARTRVLATAQHRRMLDQVLGLFEIEPDVDLDLMRPEQSLAELTARMITALDQSLQDERPDVVLAQGDTTTVLATGLACFYLRIAFGHVEAGLRTGDLANPFPEEMNRTVASRLARFHFAPTAAARANLLWEGIADAAIHVTGNTVIDALLQVATRDVPLPPGLDGTRRLILVTAHRRESFGLPLRQAFGALRALADRNQDVQILYPVHLNPSVSGPARELLSGHPRIVLCEPLEYAPFVSAMKRAYLIVTDSGGVQEEAPALGKPVLVLRDQTERPEAVAEGVVKLVGTSPERILFEAQRLLDDPQAYAAMARGVSPYGDGHAAERIVAVLRDSLS